MDSLKILHKSLGSSYSLGSTQSTEVSDLLGDRDQVRRWKTCLREIVFVQSEESFQILANDSQWESYTSQEALSFLYEILCGLKSRVFGETEVFGQFKNFLSENSDFVLFQSSLWPNVLRDIKKIRETHLQNLGARGYGGYLRAHLKDSRMMLMLGTGHLAQELLPWMTAHQLKILSRDPKMAQGRAPWNSLDVVSQEEAIKSAYLFTQIIVAAPISDEAVGAFLNQQESLQVFDYRAKTEGRLRALCEKKSFDYHSLEDVFRATENLDLQHQQLRLQVFQLIRTKTQELHLRRHFRPQGWDDLWS